MGRLARSTAWFAVRARALRVRRRREWDAIAFRAVPDAEVSRLVLPRAGAGTNHKGNKWEGTYVLRAVLASAVIGMVRGTQPSGRKYRTTT